MPILRTIPKLPLQPPPPLRIRQNFPFDVQRWTFDVRRSHFILYPFFLLLPRINHRVRPLHIVIKTLQIRVLSTFPRLQQRSPWTGPPHPGMEKDCRSSPNRYLHCMLFSPQTAKCLKVAAFALNIVYILVFWGVILYGRLRVGLILLGSYFAVGMLYALVYVIPAYLKARKTYGVPAPPLMFELGPLNNMTRTALARMKVVENKHRRSCFGKKSLHTLYECSIESEDGLWNYSAETRNEKLLAWCFEFQSSKSSLLNYSRQSGQGFFLRSDVPG